MDVSTHDGQGVLRTYVQRPPKCLRKKSTGKDDQGGMLASVIVNGHSIWALKIVAGPCFSEPIFVTKQST